MTAPPSTGMKPPDFYCWTCREVRQSPEPIPGGCLAHRCSTCGSVGLLYEYWWSSETYNTIELKTADYDHLLVPQDRRAIEAFRMSIPEYRL